MSNMATTNMPLHNDDHVYVLIVLWASFISEDSFDKRNGNDFKNKTNEDTFEQINLAKNFAVVSIKMS